MFIYAELTEIVIQSEQTFVNVLNSVHLDAIDENTENLLKARFIDQPDKNYPHDALHMYTENALAVLGNQSVLNNFQEASKDSSST